MFAIVLDDSRSHILCWRPLTYYVHARAYFSAFQNLGALDFRDNRIHKQGELNGGNYVSYLGEHGCKTIGETPVPFDVHV